MIDIYPDVIGVNNYKSISEGFNHGVKKAE